MKKTLALLLSALMLLMAVPAFAESADDAVYRTLYSGEIGTLNYLTTGMNTGEYQTTLQTGMEELQAEVSALK